MNGIRGDLVMVDVRSFTAARLGQRLTVQWDEGPERGAVGVAGLHLWMQEEACLANLTVFVLEDAFRLAEASGMIPPRRKPCQLVRRYHDDRWQRRLSPEE